MEPCPTIPRTHIRNSGISTHIDLGKPHLTAVRAAAQIYQAELTGDTVVPLNELILVSEAGFA